MHWLEHQEEKLAREKCAFLQSFFSFNPKNPLILETLDARLDTTLAVIMQRQTNFIRNLLSYMKHLLVQLNGFRKIQTLRFMV